MLLMAAALAVSGCTRNEPSGSASADIAAKFAELEAAQADRLIRYLRDKGDDRVRWGSDEASFTVLDPGGFKRVAAITGIVMVQLEKVEPYMDGYNVYFRVGNPSTADIAGVAGELKWGKAGQTRNTKSFDVPATFRAGHWTTLKLTTGAVQKGDFEEVGIAPKFESIRLTPN